MKGNRTVLVLILIMTTVAVSVSCVTIYALYRAAFDQQRERLIETAQSRARMLEAMLRHENWESPIVADPALHGSPLSAALHVVNDAHERFRGFGDTGEFTLAQIEDDRIVFLLSHRHYDLESPKSVALSAEIAEPMRRALSGDSGTVLGLDYRGVRVLAAHEPISGHDLGVVAKIDLAEVRAPFIKAGLLAGTAGIMFVSIGTLLFLRIGGALAQRIDESEQRYRGLFESTTDMTHDLGERVKELNCLLDLSAFAARPGVSMAEMMRRAIDLIPPAWQFPSITCARIVVDGDVFQTENFGPTIWKQATEIVVDGVSTGTIEVCYLEERPQADEGPFLKEERALIGGISARLGDFIKGKRSEEALQSERDNLATIYDAMKDGAYVADSNLQLQYVNSALMSTFGPWKGSTCYKYLIGRDSPCAECMSDRVLSGETAQWEWYSDRTNRTYDIVATPLKQPDGSTCKLEILRDITERKHAEQKLKGLNESLEQRVSERTEALEKRAGQLRHLAAELTQTEQRERRRLAQILHDHFQQILWGAKLKLGALKRRPLEQTVLAERIDSVVGVLDQAVQASKSLTVELYPPILRSSGLTPALEWLASSMQEQHGLHIELEIEPEVDAVAGDVRDVLFQAVRELLFNVIKHANVNRATVGASRLKGNKIQIVVADQGVGLDTSRALHIGAGAGGFGLFTVRERLELLGGQLSIKSDSGRGTRVTVIAPLDPPPGVS
jgi:signal transduction histidine kinase